MKSIKRYHDCGNGFRGEVKTIKRKVPNTITKKFTFCSFCGKDMRKR